MRRRKKFKLPSRRAIWRSIYQSLPMVETGKRDVLLIFGCQRSGTTMFAEAFRADINSKVFGESGLCDRGEIRLPALEIVRERLERAKAGLRVAKPLVESQRAREILDFFPSAKAIWMYRHYADVARSAAKRFSQQAPYRNLRPIADPSLPSDFAAENVSGQTSDLVANQFAEGMNSDTAQALYWYVRNITYFEQELDRHGRILLCSYESFVQSPVESMQRVYGFLGRELPSTKIVAHISAPSRTRNKVDLELPVAVRNVCDSLYERLQTTERDLADKWPAVTHA